MAGDGEGSPPRCGLLCKRLSRDGAVCRRCGDLTIADLAAVPALYVELHLRLPRGQGSGDKVSGSRTPPLPLSVEVLDHMRLVLDQLGGWVGLIVEDSRGGLVGPADRSLMSLVGWLRPRGEWCLSQSWAGEFAGEVREWAHRARSIARLYDERPELKAGVPCPRCEFLTLVREPGDSDVVCARAACRTVLRPDEFTSWARLYAANPRQAANEWERAQTMRVTAAELDDDPSLRSHAARLRARATELEQTA